MKLRIEIDLDNAAFDPLDVPRGQDPEGFREAGPVADILRGIADTIDGGFVPEIVYAPRDVNGNHVATYELIKDGAPDREAELAAIVAEVKAWAQSSKPKGGNPYGLPFVKRADRLTDPKSPFASR